jgi:hypothetical protein
MEMSAEYWAFLRLRDGASEHRQARRLERLFRQSVGTRDIAIEMPGSDFSGTRVSGSSLPAVAP